MESFDFDDPLANHEGATLGSAPAGCELAEGNWLQTKPLTAITSCPCQSLPHVQPVLAPSARKSMKDRTPWCWTGQSLYDEFVLAVL